MVNYLISLIDYVAWVEATSKRITLYGDELWGYVLAYTNFLNQKNELWMFVPCDEHGEYIPEPNKDDYRSTYDCAFHGYNWMKYYSEAVERYDQLKEECLFKDFTYNPENSQLFHKGKLVWFTELRGTLNEFSNNPFEFTDKAKEKISLKSLG